MSRFAVTPEYLALVDLTTLQPLERLDRPGLLAVAAHVGAVRLIDNAILDPTALPIHDSNPGEAKTRCSV
jgi:pantoate--beta-alanine ligase